MAIGKLYWMVDGIQLKMLHWWILAANPCNVAAARFLKSIKWFALRSSCTNFTKESMSRVSYTWSIFRVTPYRCSALNVCVVPPPQGASGAQSFLGRMRKWSSNMRTGHFKMRTEIQHAVPSIMLRQPRKFNPCPFHHAFPDRTDFVRQVLSGKCPFVQDAGE